MRAAVAKRLLRALAAAAAAVLVAPSIAPAVAESEPVLRELESVEDLRSAFDRDHGEVRLVLLLSPT